MSHFTTYKTARSKSIVAAVLAILLQLNFWIGGYGKGFQLMTE